MVDYLPQKSGAIFLVEPARLDANRFEFTLHSAPERVLEIWDSTNLTGWLLVGRVTNTDGAVAFTNFAPMTDRLFFRVRLVE